MTHIIFLQTFGEKEATYEEDPSFDSHCYSLCLLLVASEYHQSGRGSQYVFAILEDLILILLIFLDPMASLGFSM